MMRHSVIVPGLGLALSMAPLLHAACISLDTPNIAYVQDFNTLSNVAGSTTNSLSIPGWFLTESGGSVRDNEQYAVDTGASSVGDSYSYGSAATTERALGSVRAGTLVPVFGACFTNNTGFAIVSLSVSYIGEEWRLGTAARTDELDFQFSADATDLATGNWTDVPALKFVTPDTLTVGAKNGNSAGERTVMTSSLAPIGIANGATFWIRWIDADASGGDDGLAIDDFTLTPDDRIFADDFD